MMLLRALTIMLTSSAAVALADPEFASDIAHTSSTALTSLEQLRARVERLEAASVRRSDAPEAVCAQRMSVLERNLDEVK